MFGRDLLLKLFDNIFTNKTSITRIKTAIAEIQNKKTISKDKKEDKSIKDIID